MSQLTAKSYKNLSVASFLLALSIIIGAFAAHGLEAKLTPTALKTFKTGVFYHQLHAVGLLILPLIEYLFKLRLEKERLFIYLGILLFSANCYIYAMTQIKAFAMIVPFGGISFIIAWMLLSFKALKKSKALS